MKLKYYMCGFGSGIILAVLVLVIANKITAGSGAASNVNQQGTTVVMVTHDSDFSKYGDRCIHMKDGKITSSTVEI